MAVIYYPSNAIVSFKSLASGMTGLFVNVSPDQVIVLTGSVNSTSADFLTASYALSFLASSSHADTATTASFALSAATAADILGNQVFK